MSLGKDSSSSFLPPTSPPPSPGRAEKLAQADLAHGIDLRRCFFLKATPWKEKKKTKKERQRGGWKRERERRREWKFDTWDGGDECVSGGCLAVIRGVGSNGWDEEEQEMKSGILLRV